MPRQPQPGHARLDTLGEDALRVLGSERALLVLFVVVGGRGLAERRRGICWESPTITADGRARARRSPAPRSLGRLVEDEREVEGTDRAG
ncbi:hypothetical protein GS575_27995 [Rhodococcus hoagii]|nr:hypothetical protein [Prescottella equi]